MAKRILPPEHAHTMSSMRHVLLPTLRSAVDSGDAKTAKNIFRMLAGPKAASALPKRAELETVAIWLNAQNEIAHEHMVH